MNKMNRGSVQKLNHVMLADFTAEEYLNVGSFSLEQLNYTVFKMKGVETTLSGKG